jgi:hypothetical protein
MLKPLNGWEEIRKALSFIEGLYHFSRHTLAGVEVYQEPEVSKVRVFFRNLDELDSYLAPIIERMQLDLELMFEQLPYELDILREVYGRIVLDYPSDTNRSREMMP